MSEPRAEEPNRGGLLAQGARLFGAGLALLLVSPASWSLASSERWLGTVALYAPVLGQLAGLALARLVTGRWAWAAAFGLVGALPWLMHFGEPEAGVYAPGLMGLSLALPALASVAAVISDRRAPPP